MSEVVRMEDSIVQANHEGALLKSDLNEHKFSGFMNRGRVDGN